MDRVELGIGWSLEIGRSASGSVAGWGETGKSNIVKKTLGNTWKTKRIWLCM